MLAGLEELMPYLSIAVLCVLMRLKWKNSAACCSELLGGSARDRCNQQDPEYSPGRSKDIIKWQCLYLCMCERENCK